MSDVTLGARSTPGPTAVTAALTATTAGGSGARRPSAELA